jgi:hypothetical protein
MTRADMLEACPAYAGFSNRNILPIILEGWRLLLEALPATRELSVDRSDRSQGDGLALPTARCNFKVG